MTTAQASAYDWLLERRCDERRKYSKCGCCKGKKKVNPCEAAEILADKVYNNQADIKEVIAFIVKKKCHNRFCNHKGCVNADHLIERLERDLLREAA